MTRWARGKNLNKKKPHHSTSWESLKKLRSEFQNDKTAKSEISLAIHKDERREDRRLKRMDNRSDKNVCFNCRKPGHLANHCPNVNGPTESGICFKCGSTEHSLKVCRLRLKNGELPYATCFICNNKGHLSNQCPDNPKGLYPNGGSCRNCGSVEHFRKDCPNNLQKNNKKEEYLPLLSMNNIDDIVEETPLKLTEHVKKIKVVKF